MRTIRRKGDTITLDDFYCGMGGETTGAKAIGLQVRNCFNHWDLAIDVHNTNHPDVIHHQADIGTYDVRAYAPSQLAWFSPECKTFSAAAGISQYKLKQKSLPGFEQYDLTPAQERSRVTAGDVLRHVQVHRYEAFVVENVVQFRDWERFDSWLTEIINFDYDWEIVYLNSMFAHPTPQSRDRMYVVCWRKGNRKPNLQITPRAWCEKCGCDVDGVQSWKPGRRVAWGRYKDQYVYTCPTCTFEVEPYYYCAANLIDFSDIGTRIGDRKKPLSENTMNRIRYGLKKYLSGGIVDMAFTQSGEKRVSALYKPMPTQTTRLNHGVFLTVHRVNSNAIAVSDPLNTQVSTAIQHGIVYPFIASYQRRDNAASQIADPLPTVTAEGNRHALIAAPFITTYNGNSVYAQAHDPLPTVTTVEKHGLVSRPLPDVEDCYFRMLNVDEIKRAMGFQDDYVVFGRQKDKVKLCGHAVTPPAASVLLERLVEVVS